MRGEIEQYLRRIKLMENQTEIIIGAVIVIAIAIGLIKGAIKTFQRNWIAALVLLVVLTPVWIIWAFIELFTGKINEVPQKISNPNFNVNIVNQPNVTTQKNTNLPNEEYAKIIDASVLDDQQMEDQSETTLSKSDVKECPYCAEKVRLNAIICRFCDREI